jgi:anti-anti-sigma factor
VAGEDAWTLYNTVISQQGKRVVVLDLTRVSRIDAGGLGVLVSLKRWARVAGVRLQLVPSQAVQELLDLTGLGSQFKIRPSQERTVHVGPPGWLLGWQHNGGRG